jgi:hypothetical protein
MRRRSPAAPFWLLARDLNRLSPAAAGFAAWLTGRMAALG